MLQPLVGSYAKISGCPICFEENHDSMVQCPYLLSEFQTFRPTDNNIPCHLKVPWTLSIGKTCIEFSQGVGTGMAPGEGKGTSNG